MSVLTNVALLIIAIILLIVLIKRGLKMDWQNLIIGLFFVSLLVIAVPELLGHPKSGWLAPYMGKIWQSLFQKANQVIKAL